MKKSWPEWTTCTTRPLDFLSVTDHASSWGFFACLRLRSQTLEYRFATAGTLQHPTDPNEPNLVDGGRSNAAFINGINNYDAERDAYPTELKSAIWTDVAHRRQVAHPALYRVLDMNGPPCATPTCLLRRFRDSADVAAGWLPYSAQLPVIRRISGLPSLSMSQAAGTIDPHNGNLSNGANWDSGLRWRRHRQ